MTSSLKGHSPDKTISKSMKILENFHWIWMLLNLNLRVINLKASFINDVTTTGLFGFPNPQFVGIRLDAQIYRNLSLPSRDIMYQRSLIPQQIVFNSFLHNLSKNCTEICTYSIKACYQKSLFLITNFVTFSIT